MRFTLVFDRPWAEEFVQGTNVKAVIVPPPTKHTLLWKTWCSVSLPTALSLLRPTLFFSPDGFAPTRGKIPQVAAFHDLNFVHLPSMMPPNVAAFYNAYTPRIIRHSKRLVTVSEHAKNDISTQYNVPPSLIDVAYNGVNTMYRPLDSETITQVRNSVAEGKPYLVYVGSLHARKNVDRMIRAYAQYAEYMQEQTLPLVLVGRKLWWDPALDEVLAAMPSHGKVIFTGRVSEQDLHRYLASALALVYVPVFEGFGIPVIEAMACNVPVLTSNVTSLPEVAATAALYANPFSVDDISKQMIEISQNHNLRSSLIQRGSRRVLDFSWEKTADNVWASLLKSLA